MISAAFLLDTNLPPTKKTHQISSSQSGGQGIVGCALTNVPLLEIPKISLIYWVFNG